MKKTFINLSDKPLNAADKRGITEPCAYYGDRSRRAFLIRDRGNQIVCEKCISEGVGKDDPRFKK